jgi:hypothetical protein
LGGADTTGLLRTERNREELIVLITILVVLGIIAAALYILRGRRA